MKIISPKQNFRTWVWLLVAVATLVAVVGFLTHPNSGGETRSNDAVQAKGRDITVVQIQSGHHAAAISAMAQVEPRWSTALRSQIDGNLVQVSDAFQPGMTVAAGQVLAVVDSTAWVANLAEAKVRLAVAEMNLLRELQEASEAQRNWQDSGLGEEPDSRLVLHGPQTEAARVERDAAKAARDWAANQLAQTVIRAPFPGVITSRHISRGESVMAGQDVGGVFAIDAFEVAVPIPHQLWQALPTPLVGAQAELLSPNGSGKWQAQVIRIGSTVDPASHMRTLYLEIPRPLESQPQLLPGNFVEVLLRGRQVDGLLEIPEGAMTRKGEIWYIDPQNRLARFEAEVVFTRNGLVYVREPYAAYSWNIVRFPLSSYLTG